MSKVIVTTEAELRAAMKRRDSEIIVANKDLAQKIHRLKAIAPPVAIAAITMVGAGALMGPIGLLPGSIVLGLTGAEIVIIVALVLVVGAGLTLALVKDYDEVEFDASGKIVLRRRSKR
jgi:hypothetical protein